MKNLGGEGDGGQGFADDMYCSPALLFAGIILTLKLTADFVAVCTRPGFSKHNLPNMICDNNQGTLAVI